MRLPMWRRKQDEELEEEVRTHLEMAVRDRIERGESRSQAEAAARREFGNALLVREVTRDMWGWASLERLSQDVRYALRLLIKSPGFSIVAIATLVLGIGANTALFSVVNGVLLNPLPFAHPEQLVALHESKPNFASGSISFPNFRDWRSQNHTFSAMATARPYAFSLTGLGKAEQVNGRFVSSDLFSVLGVKPVLGRTFATGEDEIGAAPIVVISEGMWKRRFGSAPDVMGRGLTLDGKTYTIVGIVPGSVDMLGRTPQATDVFVPLGQWNNSLLPNRNAGLGLHGIGRMNAGVTLAQARADMERVTGNLAAAYPEDNKGIGATLVPLKQDVVGQVQPVLMVLLGAVGFVLLIACANVGNLLLARSAGRKREFAVRAALGASRTRVVRQLLTESILLAFTGGGLGLLLASWGTRAALAALPVSLPRASEIGMDGRVLAFTAGISILAGVLFGLAPALRTWQPNLHEMLQEGGRGVSGARHRTQSAFVVAQIAMALVLLIGAGLMIRSLVRLWNVNPGFDSRNVLALGLSLPPAMMNAPPDAIRAAFRELNVSVAATPGVRAASVSWGAVPLAGDDERLFWLDGQPKPANSNDMNWALSYVVEPDYLKVMGIQLERGRFFSERDNEHANLVAVVDDVFAAKYFPGQDPIGKRIHLQLDNQVVEIVGVVGHVKQWGLDTDEKRSLRTQMYTPFMQLSDQAMSLSPSGTTVLVRHEGSSAAVLEAIRRTSQRMSAEQVIFAPQTMDEIISATLSTRRFSMVLLATFAGLALTLACIGLYGVVSYAVGQRAHEIGVRMALGAQRADVLRMVLMQGARMAAVGVAIGLAAALALTQLMAGMLYGVKATDPLTFATVAVLLCALALAACYVPARRAMLVDPMRVLRYE